MHHSFLPLTLLVVAQALYSCPILTCQWQAPNICASLVSSNSIALNSKPCDGLHQCNFDQILNWYSLSPTESLQCQPAQVISLIDAWTCGNRQTGKDLVSGNYPRTCLGDSDCTLQDGTTNGCVCAPRTTSSSGYCQPNASSAYYQSYWDLCTSNGNVIDGQYEGFYWYLRLQFAVYYDAADLPNCKETLWEFSQFTTATSVLNAASGLLIPTLFLV